MLDQGQEHYAAKLAEFYPFSGQQITELLNEIILSGLNMEEAITAVKNDELYEATVLELQEENERLRKDNKDLFHDNKDLRFDNVQLEHGNEDLRFDLDSSGY